jgi:hypothetical protein
VSISYRHPSYNSKNSVCKLSVRSLQTVRNFTDNLLVSHHSLFFASSKSPITISYRQLSHHHCTWPEALKMGLVAATRRDKMLLPRNPNRARCPGISWQEDGKLFGQLARRRPCLCVEKVQRVHDSVCVSHTRYTAQISVCVSSTNEWHKWTLRSRPTRCEAVPRRRRPTRSTRPRAASLPLSDPKTPK